MRRGAFASHRRKKDPSAFYFFCLALVEEEDVVRNVWNEKKLFGFYYIVVYEMINDFILSKERD